MKGKLFTFKKKLGSLFQVKLLALSILAVLAGCSLFTPMGVARYTAEPVVVGTQIVCCKVTVYNTQRAVVEVLNKVAYVADYDVEIGRASCRERVSSPV